MDEGHGTQTRPAILLWTVRTRAGAGGRGSVAPSPHRLGLTALPSGVAALSNPPPNEEEVKRCWGQWGAPEAVS